jgi:hypothetical protein
MLFSTHPIRRTTIVFLIFKLAYGARYKSYSTPPIFLELTPQQIDVLLHEIDSLDEDKLQEMHAEFLELW